MLGGAAGDMAFTNGDRVRVRVQGTGTLAGAQYGFDGRVVQASANGRLLVVEGGRHERYVLFLGLADLFYRDLAVKELEVEVEAIPLKGNHEPRHDILSNVAGGSN